MYRKVKSVEYVCIQAYVFEKAEFDQFNVMCLPRGACFARGVFAMHNGMLKGQALMSVLLKARAPMLKMRCISDSAQQDALEHAG